MGYRVLAFASVLIGLGLARTLSPPEHDSLVVRVDLDQKADPKPELARAVLSRREVVPSKPNNAGMSPVDSETWVQEKAPNGLDWRRTTIQVVRQEDGRPIAGASIRIHACDWDERREDPPELLYSAVTDSCGAASFHHRLVAEDVQLHVHARGRAVERIGYSLNQLRSQEVVLYPGRPLEVRVLDGHGRPVPEVELTLAELSRVHETAPLPEPHDDDPPQVLTWESHTDGKGRASFQGIASGVSFLVHLDLDGSGELQSRPLWLDAGIEPESMTIRLPKLGSLSGRLVARTPRDLDGLWLTLIPTRTSWRYAEAFEHTDADGSFRFTDVPAGEYELIVESRQVEVRRPLIVNVGENPSLVIPLPEAWTFTGQVVIERPPGAARETWAREFKLRSLQSDEYISFKIDAEGAFAVPQLIDPAYELELDPYEVRRFGLRSPHQISRTRPEQTIVVEAGSARIRGRVGQLADRDDELTICLFRGDSLRMRRTPDPVFEFDKLVPGEWRAVAMGERSAFRDLGSRVLRASDVWDLGTIDLAPAPIQHGTVLDADGVPLPGVEIDHSDVDDPDDWTGHQHVYTETDSSGRFTLQSGAGGWLTFLHPDHAPGVRPRDSFTDGSAIQLTRGRIVHGQLAAGRHPLAGLPILLERTGTEGILMDECLGVTDADGRFQIPRVPPGDYVLQIEGALHWELPEFPVHVQATDVFLPLIEWEE